MPARFLVASSWFPFVFRFLVLVVLIVESPRFLPVVAALEPLLSPLLVPNFRPWVNKLLTFFLFSVSPNRPIRCLVFFRDLTEREAEAAMDEFGQSDITSIRNKSAFLMSILRSVSQSVIQQYRQSVKARSAQRFLPR